MILLMTEISRGSSWPPRSGGQTGKSGNVSTSLWPETRLGLRSHAAHVDETSMEEIVDSSRREGSSTDAGLPRGQDGKFSSSSSSIRGRQLLNCLALRPPIGPNALPLINQKPNDKGEGLYPP